MERGAIVEGKVYGPAYIGRGAFVSKDTVIEHYVDVEPESSLLGGSLSRTLVLEQSVLKLGTSRMIDSVVGPKSRINVNSDLRAMIRTVVAQESELALE